MKVIHVGDSTFPLRIGRQRLALVHDREHTVSREAVIQLFLDGMCVGTASDFSVDDGDQLHGHIRLDKKLDLEELVCSLVWEHGRLCGINLQKHKLLVDDKTGMVMIDDQTGARIYNG